MKQIVPWKCHCCEGKFDTLDGGLCKKCGRPTCNSCFGVGRFRRALLWTKPESLVCRSCAESEAAESSSDREL
jgi:hypothetical protein